MSKHQGASPNLLVHADCIDALKFIPPAQFDLGYLDPPFSVGVSFAAWTRGTARSKGRIAYDDKWETFEAYMTWLRARIVVVRSLLADHGTMWLHLDQRAVHDAKIACDEIFGRAHFAGEIIWTPGNGAKAKKGPGLGHQTLLLYRKGKDAIWNAKDPALREPFAETSLKMHFQNRDENGRGFRDRTIGARTYRYYADEGRAIGTVWTDCPSMLANTPLRKETTGYPTQKPLKLLDRIVRASSLENGWVLDPFAGSGTTLVAAARANRHFVGFDIGTIAIETTEKRLLGEGIAYRCEAKATRASIGVADVAPTA